MEYMKVSQDLETYGITYFEVVNKNKTQVLLGIDALGINIYDKNNKLSPTLGFPWSEINTIRTSKENRISAANRYIGSTTGCTITEKAPTRAFSWLEAPTSAFTFKTLLRHYAKRALTPRSLNVKLGPRRNYHKGRAAIRHYANPYDNCVGVK